MSDFLCGHWGYELRSYVWWASPRPTEPSPCPPLCVWLSEQAALLTHQLSASVTEFVFWEREFYTTYIHFSLLDPLPLPCSANEALILMICRDPVWFRSCYLGCDHFLARQLALVHTPDSTGQSLRASHFVLVTDGPRPPPPTPPRSAFWMPGLKEYTTAFGISFSFFEDKIFLYSQDWAKTCYVAQAGS